MHWLLHSAAVQLEDLELLSACVGWHLEGAAEDPVGGEVALRLAGLFRLRFAISRAGASASVEMLPGGWVLRRDAGVRRLVCGGEGGVPSIFASCGFWRRRKLEILSNASYATADDSVAAAAECKVPTDRRALLAALAGGGEGEAAGAAPAAEVRWAQGEGAASSGAKVSALVQATTARLR